MMQMTETILCLYNHYGVASTWIASVEWQCGQLRSSSVYGWSSQSTGMWPTSWKVAQVGEVLAAAWDSDVQLCSIRTA